MNPPSASNTPEARTNLDLPPAQTEDAVNSPHAATRPESVPVVPVRRTEQEIRDLVANWKAIRPSTSKPPEASRLITTNCLPSAKSRKPPWEAKRQREVEKKAGELGLPGHSEFARYILGMECHIGLMQRRLDRLESGDRQSPRPTP